MTPLTQLENFNLKPIVTLTTLIAAILSWIVYPHYNLTISTVFFIFVNISFFILAKEFVTDYYKLYSIDLTTYYFDHPDRIPIPEPLLILLSPYLSFLKISTCKGVMLIKYILIFSICYAHSCFTYHFYLTLTYLTIYAISIAKYRLQYTRAFLLRFSKCLLFLILFCILYVRIFAISWRYCIAGAHGASIVPMTSDCSFDVSTLFIIISFTTHILFGILLYYIGTRQPDLNIHHIFDNIRCYFCTTPNPSPKISEPEVPIPISNEIVPQLISLRDIPDDSYVFVDILLSLYIFYFQVKDSRKREVWTLAIINFVTRFYKTKDLVEKVMDIILGDEVLLFQPPIQPQAGECGARKLLNRWRDSTEGELLSKLKRVTFGLMTAGLVTAYDLPFTKIGLQSWKSSSKDIKFTSVHDMLYSVADLFVSFYETGYECFLSCSLQPLIVADRECSTWITEVEAIHEEISRLPTNSNPDHQKILTTMTSLVERGRMLDRKMNPRIISLYYRPLITERLRFAQKFGIPSFRRPPFSLTIAGPPGIGKSAVTKLLVDHYHQVVKTENIYPDLEWDPSSNMYSVNYEDEYWSGFRGAQHWCVLLDDLANEPKSWAAKGLKFSASHLIQIVNVFGMATTQAAIEDKGVIPLLPKLVIATTNNEGLHASHVSVSPASILRRLPYVITPIVKPQYCRPDSKMMKQMDEPILDPWMFELKKVKVDAMNPDHARYELVFPEPITMAQLTRYLKGEILTHERSSDTLLKTMTTRTNTILCPHGTPTIYECDMCSSSLVPQKGFLPYLQTRSLFLGVSFFSKLPTSISMPIIESLVSHGRISRAFIHQVCTNVLKRNIPTFVQKNRDTFLALSGIVGGGSLLYILFRMFPDLSTSTEEEPLPKPSKSDPNITTQNDLWTVPENFFRVPSTSKSGNLEELIASVSSSIFLLEYKSDVGEPGRVTTICLTNNLFLTVNHPFLSGTSWKCVARFGISYNKLNNAIRFVLDRDQIYYLGNDICVFNTNAMIPRKNLMNFIPNEADYAGRSIVSLGFDPMGKLERGKFLTTRSEDKAYADPDSNQIISGTFMVGRREDRPCMKGDCGTVMLSKSHKGYFISGIHCAGSTIDTSIALITQLDRKSILTINVPQSGYLLPYETDEYYSCNLEGKRLLKGPGQKQIADWMDCGYCHFLGTFDRRISATSKTQYTMIKDEVMQTLHVDCPYLPPLMKPIFEDKVWKNPFTISANKQSRIPPYFRESVLDVAVKDFIFKLTYSTDWLSNVKTESQSVAINGIIGNDMIHSLKRDTSGGHLFPGMKLKYMSMVDDNIYMVSPAVQERIDYIEEQYCKGHRVGILFDGTLKDEAITLAKRAEGKTRVFTACDMAFSIVVRKQYIRITEAIMRSNFISECAAGMDHYRAWPALYKYLTRFGEDCIVAGDYSSFDKCMPPILIERAFYIMDYLRNLVNPLSSKDILISRGIATDVAFPVTNLNGDLFQFFGGNSSGHPLTVIINSLVNSLYVRYVYYDSNRAFGSFLDNVRLMTLGDDNIFGSKDPTFNHTSLANGLAKLEIKYTMADKESESVPFLNIEEVDFLKRKFRYLHGMCVAPISMDSITRSLLIFTNHDIISEEERLANTYLSARREWALHGQNVFEIMTSRMDIIFSKHPQIQRFFINKHKLSFIDTLRWCYEDDDKQKIVL